MCAGSADMGFGLQGQSPGGGHKGAKPPEAYVIAAL